MHHEVVFRPLPVSLAFLVACGSEPGAPPSEEVFPVIVRFDAARTNVRAGEVLDLNYQVRDADTVEIRPDLLAPSPALSGLVTTPPLERSMVFLLVAKSAVGESTQPLAISVQPLAAKPPQVLAFTATPEEISEGMETTIAWNVEGADTIQVRDQDGALLLESQSPAEDMIVAPRISTEYHLLATNTLGSAGARITVHVLGGDRPRITRFEASPETITAPAEANVSWATEGADLLALLVGGVALRDFPGGATGSFSVAVSGTTVFELRAQNRAGETSAMTTVTLAPPSDVDPPELVHAEIVTTQAEGAQVPIMVRATDAGEGIEEVRIYYRTQGAPAFDAVLLVANGPDYSGVISASAVIPPGVEYYLEASDRADPANVARLPTGAPSERFAFGVTPVDRAVPTIRHTPSAVGWLAQAPQTIAAEVVDPGSGVGMVTLFYRVMGSASFSNVSLFAVGGDLFSATIPGSQVQPPAVEYYLLAGDGASPSNTAFDPSGAPGALHRITVSSSDVDPPQINFVGPVGAQTANGAVALQAVVSDASPLASLTVFYRRPGLPTFSSVPMFLVGTEYRGSIPGVAVTPPEIEYYLEASDSAMPANSARSPAGAPAMLHRFSVVVIDRNPPAILHDPPASPQPPQLVVLITADLADVSGIGAANLSFRRIGTGAYTTLSLVPIGGGTYRAAIPATAVLPPGIEYYLDSADGASPPNAGRLPITAPAGLLSFEVGVRETELNNTPATADVLLSAGLLDNAGLGSIAPSTDLDYFSIDVPAGAFYNLRLESTSGGIGSCPNPASTVLRLYASDGVTQLASDSVDGIASCSLIEAGLDTGARALAPGRYYVRIEESGNNAVIGTYELRATLSATRCGNGILEVPAGEQCDDSNTVASDGCGATCLVEPEGLAVAPGATLLGAITPAGENDVFAIDIAAGQYLRAEISDGAGGCPGDLWLDLLGVNASTVLGSDDDDGPGMCPRVDPVTDLFATNLPPGRYYLRVRAFLPTAVIAQYSLRIDLLDALCGDGRRGGAEQCDDGNSRPFDGCSPSCQWEIAGTVSGQGAVFNDSIDPAGSSDWYEIIVQQGDSLRAETFTPTAGTCTDDTRLRLFAANRVTEIVSDDQDGIGDCSLIDPGRDLQARNLAAGTYFLVVDEYLNDDVIADYVLDVELSRGGCGNRFLEGLESCDDGNTLGGDGCSSQCAIEGTPEIEPNDTSVSAMPLITATSSRTAQVRGLIDDASDIDLFSVVVPQGWDLLAAISDGQGGCPQPTSVRLRGTNGTSSLVFDSNDGPGECGRISAGLDLEVQGLSAGTYFVEVRAPAGSALVYTLDVRVLPADGCGNLYLDSLSEECDDGGTVSGDGCSATCQLELRETATNDVPAMANPIPAGVQMIGGTVDRAADIDWFSVVVPAGGSVLAFTHDGSWDQCSFGVDTLLTLVGPNGISEIADDDDDAAGLCSRIEKVEAAGLAGGTYYLRVEPFQGANYDYALSVRVFGP